MKVRSCILSPLAARDIAIMCAVLLTTPVAARADGPVVTFFGLTRGNDVLLVAHSEGGLPTFQPTLGYAFRIVIEGAPGASGAPVGSSAFGTSTDPAGPPDLQIISNRQLGDGNMAVCAGGVPAVTDFSSADALNDFACHFVNETGLPMGRVHNDGCLFSETIMGTFVVPASTVEFCTALVPSFLAFPLGDTILSVRLRDVTGAVGPVAQIGVHVVADASPTPVRSNTPTATPTPTPPSPSCVGDCNGNRQVTANELVTLVNIALDNALPPVCPDGIPSDRTVDIALILQAVNNVPYYCNG